MWRDPYQRDFYYWGRVQCQTHADLSAFGQRGGKETAMPRPIRWSRTAVRASKLAESVGEVCAAALRGRRLATCIKFAASDNCPMRPSKHATTFRMQPPQQNDLLQTTWCIGIL